MKFKNIVPLYLKYTQEIDWIRGIYKKCSNQQLYGASSKICIFFQSSFLWSISWAPDVAWRSLKRGIDPEQQIRSFLSRSSEITTRSVDRVAAPLAETAVPRTRPDRLVVWNEVVFVGPLFHHLVEVILKRDAGRTNNGHKVEREISYVFLKIAGELPLVAVRVLILIWQGLRGQYQNDDEEDWVEDDALDQYPFEAFEKVRARLYSVVFIPLPKPHALEDVDEVD